MPLDRFTNTEEVYSKQPTFGQVFDPKDAPLIGANSKFVELTEQDVVGIGVPPITAATTEIHTYSPEGVLLGSRTAPITYVGNDEEGRTLYVKPERNIRESGFTNGTYTLVYNFLHNIVDGLRIKEISADRTEIKVQAPNINGLSSYYQLNQPNSAIDGNNSYVTPFADTYIPAQANFGANDLYPIINGQFFGQFGGLYNTELEYPADSPTTRWIPVTQGVLEAGIPEGKNVTDWTTFIEIDILDTVLAGGGFFGFTQKYKATGRFDRFKLIKNQDTTLSWIRKGGTFTSQENLPPDVPISLRNAFSTPAYISVGSPTDWKLTYKAYDLNLNTVNEAIFKLYKPLRGDINVNDRFDLTLDLRKPYIEKLILYPNTEEGAVDFFSDPNFNIDLNNQKGSIGEFETWKSLLNANYPTNQQIIDNFFSASFGDVKLNIDYSDFENFINFSSAEERVRNFRYKLRLIEGYNDRISLLENVSGSDALTNISSSRLRKETLIGGFDGFEKFLYYNHDSSLYTHYSSSEFKIEPYPKSSRNPDILYHVTSSNGTTWFNNTIETAKSYDSQNAALLTKVIPANLAFDEKNEEYITFVQMLGHQFDMSYNYISELTQINSREEHPKDGLSNDLLEFVASSFGWELYNGYSDTALWQYEFGIGSDGAPQQSGSLYSKPTREIVSETWRRLVNSLPGIYKTKGSARSLKALISSYGIPSAFLKIREYGGPRVKEDKNIYEQERFIYKLQASATKYLSNPWDSINGDRPNTIEVIEKLPQANHHILRIANGSDTIDCFWDYGIDEGARIRMVSDTTAISSSYVPYKFRRDVAFMITSGSGGVTINAAWVDDWGNILANPTASITSVSSEFNTAWTSGGTTSTVRVPGSTLTSTASLQEVRYYRDTLSNEIIKEHAKNREAYFADDNTTDLDLDTAFDKVSYRIFTDSTFNSNSSSISSLHPNQEFTQSANSRILSASLVGFRRSDLIGEVDTQFVTTPSVGALNLTNKKVRIESSSLKGPLLFERSNEKSQYDQAPLDSNLLGTYFSTTDTINSDIYNSEGYFDIDDLVGDTDTRNIDGYDLLDFRARNYFQKYTARTSIQLILDMLSRYDMSVFDSMRQVIPARVDWHKGILIEPHVFERNNYKRPDEISYTKNMYDNDNSPIGIVSIVTGSYLVYTSSIEKDITKAAIYKYDDILRLSSSGEYFTDTNPYWEYSPTGSTILDARLSSHYLEPKYFWSTQVSASKGVEFASSASFHYARIQDTRLSLALENLLYNGCKVSSTSLTANSPDTPDNSPAVVVDTVDDNILIYNTSGVGSLSVGSGLGAGSGAGGGKKPKTIGQQRFVPAEDLIAVRNHLREKENVGTSNKVDDKNTLDSIFKNTELPLVKTRVIRPSLRPQGPSRQIETTVSSPQLSEPKVVRLSAPAIDFLVRTAERRQQRRNYNASRSAINPTSPRSPQPQYAPPRPNLSSNNPNNTGASATPSAVERDLLRGRSSRTSSLFGNPRGS